MICLSLAKWRDAVNSIEYDPDAKCTMREIRSHCQQHCRAAISIVLTRAGISPHYWICAVRRQTRRSPVDRPFWLAPVLTPTTPRNRLCFSVVVVSVGTVVLVCVPISHTISMTHCSAWTTRWMLRQMFASGFGAKPFVDHSLRRVHQGKMGTPKRLYRWWSGRLHLAALGERFSDCFWLILYGSYDSIRDVGLRKIFVRRVNRRLSYKTPATLRFDGDTMTQKLCGTYNAVVVVAIAIAIAICPYAAHPTPVVVSSCIRRCTFRRHTRPAPFRCMREQTHKHAPRNVNNCRMSTNC